MFYKVRLGIPLAMEIVPLLRVPPCFFLVTSFENIIITLSTSITCSPIPKYLKGKEMMALVREIESYLISKVVCCFHQSTISTYCDLIQLFFNLFDTILAFDLLAIVNLFWSFYMKTYYT